MLKSINFRIFSWPFEREKGCAFLTGYSCVMEILLFNAPPAHLYTDLDTKIRSPASAVTHVFFLPGSPRKPGAFWQNKSCVSVLEGLLDFISPLSIKKNIFVSIFFSFCVST